MSFIGRVDGPKPAFVPYLLFNGFFGPAQSSQPMPLLPPHSYAPTNVGSLAGCVNCPGWAGMPHPCGSSASYTRLLVPMFLIRDKQVFCFACLRAASKDGNRIAIKSAMIAMTTNNSMSVNPPRVEYRRPYRLQPCVFITVILLTTCCFVPVLTTDAKAAQHF